MEVNHGGKCGTVADDEFRMLSGNIYVERHLLFLSKMKM